MGHAEPRRADHADGHGLAMQVALVPRRSLQAVPDGVPVVEQRASATGFPLVLRDDACLHGGVARNDLSSQLGVDGQQRLGLRLVDVDQPRFERQAMLQRLGPPFAQGAARERAQCGDIRQHECRMVEGTNQILRDGQVDRRLAPDARIHHSSERRGHVHEPDATQIRRSDEACQVADDTTPDGHDGIAALDALLGQPVVERSRAGKRLAGLTGRHGEHAHLDACAMEGTLCRASVVVQHVAVGDDEGASREAGVREALAQFGFEHVPADVDRVGS